LAEDQVCEQISMKEYIDPFTGEPGKEGKPKDKNDKNKKK